MEAPVRRSAELLERRTGFRGRLLRVETDRVREPLCRGGFGPVVGREVVRHPGAVAVVAVTGGNRVVLVRQFRYAAGRALLEIPAGTLEPGESPASCARRELAEETGYRAASLRKVARFFTAPGFCDEVIHLFRADGLVPGVPHPDVGEDVETLLLPAAECRRRLRTGAFRDAKTIVGLSLGLRAEPQEDGASSEDAGGTA